MRKIDAVQVRSAVLGTAILLFSGYCALKTNRYLRVDFSSGDLLADSAGPEPNGPEGVRFDWRTTSDMKAAKPVALESQP